MSAKAQESDKLIGLMAGGDDYLAKPFSYAELLGRVKALLRRYNVYRGRSCEWDENENAYLTLNGIKIHQKFNEVYIDGVMKDMSDIEYHILLLMMQHAGKYFLHRIFMRVCGRNLISIPVTHGNGTYPKTPGKNRG